MPLRGDLELLVEAADEMAAAIDVWLECSGRGDCDHGGTADLACECRVEAAMDAYNAMRMRTRMAVGAYEAAERVVLAWERRQGSLTGDGLSPAASLGSYGPMHREVRALVAVLRGEG